MKRKIWTDLLDWKSSKPRKPLILLGARQVGKTYVLKLFGGQEFKTLHYLNFEKTEKLKNIFEQDLSPQNILEQLNFFLQTTIDITSDLIFMDEIQECPKAINSLKYFCEEVPELAICCAGSLLGLKLSEESFPVGKVTFLKLFPLTFEEFLLGIKDNKGHEYISDPQKINKITPIIHDHLWEKLKLYFIIGGLPEAINVYRATASNKLEALTTVRKTQNNIILSYLADIAKHSGKQNSMHIERLWKNIPAQLAKTLEGNAPKYSFKHVVPGINRYSGLVGSIDWLETSGLILKTHIIESINPPLLSNIKENSFKLYLFDVGLLGAIAGLSPTHIIEYTYGSYKGYFAENFIAQELTCLQKELYCWIGRTSEVEFVIENNAEILPIEVKSGQVTRSKSLNVFSEKYKTKRNIILSGQQLKIQREQRLFKLPLYLAAKIIDLSN